MKTCSRCSETKPWGQFPKDRSTKTGYHGYCRACNIEKTQSDFSRLTPEQRSLYNFRSQLRKYGLTPESYSQLLGKQGGVCAICSKQEKNKRLAVDHDHKSGKVRGLLCGQRNTGLGKFYDNVDTLSKAILYLQPDLRSLPQPLTHLT